MAVQAIEYKLAGVNYDLPPHLLEGEWSAATNMQFRRGFGQRVTGDAIIEVWGTASQHLLNVWDGTNSYWINCTASNVQVTNLTTIKTITPGTFTTPVADGGWTSGILNGIPFVNYRTDQAAYWGLDYSTPTVMAAMADAPECAAMRPYKYGLVAMDCAGSSHGTIPKESTTVAWSTFVDPGTAPSAAGDWTPTASNQAGFAELGSGGGRCVDGIQVQDSFLIGKNNSFWVMKNTGGVEVMTFRPLVSSAGLLTTNCLAEVNGIVYALTDSDLIRTDLNSTESVIDNRLRNHLFDTLGDNYKLAWIAYNRAQHELWVCVPQAAESYAQLVYQLDLASGQWGVKSGTDFIYGSMGRNNLTITTTWSGISGTWATIDRRWGESDGNVADVFVWTNGVNMREEEAETDNLTGELTRSGLDLGDPYRVKNVSRIWPDIEADAGVVVSVEAGYQDAVDGAITWPVSAAGSVTTGTDQKMDIDISGKYLAFRFSSTSVYALAGFKVEYRPAGRF